MAKDHSSEHSKEEHKKKMVVVEEVPVVEEVKHEEKIDQQASSVEHVHHEESQEVEPEEKTNYLFIIIPTALLVGALVGGLITYFSGLSRINMANGTPSPVPTIVSAEPTPSASPSGALKKDELKIQILNGSGVSGAAGKAETLLDGLGYKDIDTGNASMSDLAQTEVSIKDTKKEYLDGLIKDLAKNYEAVEASKALATTSKYDVVITIGKK